MKDGAEHSLASPAPAAAPSSGSLLALVCGLLLFIAGVVVTTGIEGFPGEFGYFPFITHPLPFVPIRGFTFEQLVAHLAGILLATPGLLLIWRGVRGGGEALRAPTQRELDKLAFWSAAFSVAMVACVMLVVLRGRAITDDELSYRFQASLLADGRLTLTGVPAFAETFVVIAPSGVTNKYLFGEPLMQVPGLLLGVPALMHIPWAAATLWALHRSVRMLADARLAAWATALVALSPMFILTSATGLSQITAFGCVAFAGLGYAWLTKERVLLGAIVVGTAVGFCASVRLQVAAPAGAVMGVLSGVWLFKRRRFAPILAMAGCFLVWVVLLAAYNSAITGSPWKMPWFADDYPEHYGFGRVWNYSTFEHTPLVSLENLLVVLVRLNAWWLGWPSSLLLLVVWYRVGRPAQGAKLWLLVGLAILLFEAGYYSTGMSDTGALYHFELLFPLAILGANAIVRGFERNAASTGSLLILHTALGFTSFFYIQTARLERLASFIHDDTDRALAQISTPAILFYETLCQESLSRGWVHSKFPERYRRDSDPIVVFPRPSARKLPEFLKRYPNRECWYVRYLPSEQLSQAVRCKDALALLNRPTTASARTPCAWVPSTATELGLYHPFTSLEQSRDPAFYEDYNGGKVLKQRSAH